VAATLAQFEYRSSTRPLPAAAAKKGLEQIYSGHRFFTDRRILPPQSNSQALYQGWSGRLDFYTQEDSDETRTTQAEFLTAVRMNATVH
jgi:hypothetical protein